ncbi:hypothetical protein PFISCL1PPCAC_21931, partial [Pristionchus fissidentatus]
LKFRVNAIGDVVRWVHPDSTKTNAIHAMCVVSLSTIFSALCYISVIRKIMEMNRVHKRERTHTRKWRQELAITIVGFSTFLSLCTATAYFSTSYWAVITDNIQKVLLDTMRGLNMIHYFSMAFVNPWMLLITNRSMR